MTETTDRDTIAYRSETVTLTRLEVATILGAVLTVLGLALPWASGIARTVNGFEYTWLAPGILSGAVLAVVLAVPGSCSRIRYGLVALLGVLLAATGVILLLGIPSLGVGIEYGLVVFLAGGLLVTGGGYTALVRQTSTMRATTVVCVGSLLVLVVGLVAVQAA